MNALTFLAAFSGAFLGLSVGVYAVFRTLGRAIADGKLPAGFAQEPGARTTLPTPPPDIPCQPCVNAGAFRADLCKTNDCATCPPGTPLTERCPRCLMLTWSAIDEELNRRRVGPPATSASEPPA